MDGDEQPSGAEGLGGADGPSLADGPSGAEQPVGPRVDFAGAGLPGPETLGGRSVELVATRVERDAPELFRISHPPDGDPRIWTYLFEGPWPDPEGFAAALESMLATERTRFYTVIVAGRPRGIVSYLNIVAAHGTIELGNIWFGPTLARTPAATEAIYLLIRHAVEDLGYRRVEWKCNALNATSRAAAQRFGFRYEGTFAQHLVVRGRNRDTAWFAMTDGRWPALRAAFETWLDPANFDAEGRQRRRLADLRDASGAR